ncbi:hypothetical protein [Novacetimonas pomaceti]|nr:hypothetical protein [Novacetimonas pomaceti]
MTIRGIRSPAAWRGTRHAATIVAMGPDAARPARNAIPSPTRA